MVNKNPMSMNVVRKALLLLALAVSPAFADDTTVSKDPAKEIIYRTNLGRAEDVKLLLQARRVA